MNSKIFVSVIIVLTVIFGYMSFKIVDEILPNAVALTAREQMMVEGRWEVQAPMTKARVTLGAVALDGKIYAFGGFNQPGGGNFGGFNDFEVYNSQTNIWQNKLGKMESSRWQFAYTEANGKIYVIGGVVIGPKVTGSVEEYDPALDQCVKKADLPSPVNYPSATSVGGKIYLFGGSTAISDVQPGTVDNVCVYDPIVDKWELLTKMPKKLYCMGVGVYKGKIYLFGGTQQNLVPVQDVYVFDPEQNSFLKLKDMPTRRFSMGIGMIDGKFYVVGGDNGDANVATATLPVVEVYDVEKNEWEDAPKMPTRRSHLSVVTLGGKLYAIGGTNIWPDGVDINESFDPSGGKSVSPNEKLATVFGAIKTGD